MTLSLNAIYQPIAEFFLQLFETNDGSSILFRFEKFGSVVSAESAYLFGPLPSRTAYFKLFAEQGT